MRAWPAAATAPRAATAAPLAPCPPGRLPAGAPKLATLSASLSLLPPPSLSLARSLRLASDADDVMLDGKLVRHQTALR